MGGPVISWSALSLPSAIDWLRDEWVDYIGPIRIKPRN